MMIRLTGPSLLEMQRRRRQTPFFRNRIDIVEEGLYRDKDRKDMRKKKIKKRPKDRSLTLGSRSAGGGVSSFALDLYHI